MSIHTAKSVEHYIAILIKYAYIDIGGVGYAENITQL
jgi:hypothetical protein